MKRPGGEVRFARQILLPEIGHVGQGRIAAATARVVSSGLAGNVADRYATGAGFPSLAPSAAPERAADYPFFSTAAADVCRGARSALDAIREAIRP